jgi:hypothetical protein
MTRSDVAKGVLIGVYNRVTGTQRGIAIGLYNDAAELFGVQIGLLNRAENNPPFFRTLPFLNAHF